MYYIIYFVECKIFCFQRSVQSSLKAEYADYPIIRILESSFFPNLFCNHKELWSIRFAIHTESSKLSEFYLSFICLDYDCALMISWTPFNPLAFLYCFSKFFTGKRLHFVMLSIGFEPMISRLSAVCFEPSKLRQRRFLRFIFFLGSTLDMDHRILHIRM